MLSIDSPTHNNTNSFELVQKRELEWPMHQFPTVVQIHETPEDVIDANKGNQYCYEHDKDNE